MVKLIGLPEALIGQSFVKASSKEELLTKYPVLKEVENKLTFKKGRVVGFAACDG